MHFARQSVMLTYKNGVEYATAGQKISFIKRAGQIKGFVSCSQTDRQTDGRTDRQTLYCTWLWQHATSKRKNKLRKQNKKQKRKVFCLAIV